MKEGINILRVSPNPEKVHKEPSVLRRIAMVGLVWGGIIIYAKQLPEIEKKDVVVPYSQLLEQATSKSICKDRIWTDQEKRKFLDSNGLEKATLQAGQSIHFKIIDREDHHGGVYVLTDSTYGNKNSNNYLGTISRSELQTYIDSRDITSSTP